MFRNTKSMPLALTFTQQLISHLEVQATDTSHEYSLHEKRGCVCFTKG